MLGGANAPVTLLYFKTKNSAGGQKISVAFDYGARIRTSGLHVEIKHFLHANGGNFRRLNFSDFIRLHVLMVQYP